MECIARLAAGGDRVLLLGSRIHIGACFTTYSIDGQPGMVARLATVALEAVLRGDLGPGPGGAAPAAAATVRTAVEAEAVVCLAHHHEHVVQVFGTVVVRGVCVGLLVERLVSPPALLLPRNASALLAGAAAALAHVAACSPQHCYGAFALRRVLLRGRSTYVLTDIGLVRAAASSNSGPGAAAAPAAAARHDLEVLARICCELASGVEPPAGVASSHAAATTYVHLAGSLLPPEVRPLLARCLLSDATAGPGSPSPEAAEVVECLAGLAHREEAALLRPHSIAPDAAAGDPMLGAGGVGSAAPPPAAAAAAAAAPGPPSEHSARRTNGGMKRPRAASPSRAALPSGQGGAGEPTQGPGGGRRRRQGMPARGPAARGAVTNVQLTSPRPGDPPF